jgi:hypothetical protein
MVEITRRGESLQVDVRGLHKLLTFKGGFELPAAAVRSARRMNEKEVWSMWKGFRIPGTHLPGVVAAGTFYKNGEKHFWDVRNAGRAIEIELSGARYDKLYVEVADPEATLRALNVT